MDNISKDIGIEKPIEFFEKTINKDNKAIDTQQGLQNIYDIAEKSLEIIDKVTITDDKGEAVGYDNSKMTEDDQFFLNFYTGSCSVGRRFVNCLCGLVS